MEFFHARLIWLRQIPSAMGKEKGYDIKEACLLLLCLCFVLGFFVPQLLLV